MVAFGVPAYVSDMADIVQRNESVLMRSYVGAVAVLVLVAFGVRRAVARIVLSRPGPPTPSEVAVLVGRDRAVPSALAALRAAGAIDAADGRLSTTGTAPADLDPLCRAVHGAIERRRTVRRLTDDRRVASAVRAVERSARLAGWLVPPGVRRLARLAGLVALILTPIASVGFAVEPWLAGLAVPPAVLATVLLSVPRVTREGRQQLSATRATTGHLHPRHSDSWATHGPAGAAVSVALYGLGALWAADPAFAQAARLPRTPVTDRAPRAGRASGGWPGYSGYHGDFDSGGWSGVPDTDDLSGGHVDDRVA